MEQTKRLIRHCPPTRFDNADYATIWCQWVEKEKIDYYIQTSDDSMKPQWQKMNELLEKSFEQFFTNDDFMDECLRLYKHNNHKPLHKISEIIKEI